jgi:hypothetical protein
MSILSQNQNSSPFLQLAARKTKSRGGGSALSRSYAAITASVSPINSSDGREATLKSHHKVSPDSLGSSDSSSSSTPIVTNNEETQDGDMMASPSTGDASGNNSSHYSNSDDIGEVPTNDDAV